MEGEEGKDWWKSSPLGRSWLETDSMVGRVSRSLIPSEEHKGSAGSPRSM